jgi:hypothetical protein
LPVSVAADAAADHDARIGGDARQHVVEDLAADIVEDHVDPVRREFLQLRADWYRPCSRWRGRILLP